MRFEREREGAVDDASVDVRAEINLANVTLLQHGRIAIVRRIVCGHVVERATGRKGKSALEPILAHQAAIAVLNHVANVDHLHAGPHPPLHVRARLAVRLRGLANLVVHRLVHAIERAFLLVRLAIRVAVERRVRHDLSRLSCGQDETAQHAVNIMQ